jgi:hypothetical protein
MNVTFEVIEVDDEVHRWHQEVFPMCVRVRKEDVLKIEPGEHDVMYMNFCNVPSRT